MNTERLAGHFELQGGHCARLGSPMYAALLARAAEELRSGGAVAGVLAPWADAPADDMVPLRFLGGLHRLVLERAAPRLALHYPSVGGTFSDVDAAWRELEATAVEHSDELARWMQSPPQTNEPGRAAVLAGGLRFATAARAGQRSARVCLVELGASAGLNLNVDRYRVTGAGAEWGPPGSAVGFESAWEGAPPPDADVQLVERRGYDLAPVDASSTEGRLLLTAYVWADQVERFERLRAALDIVAQHPVPVERASAADALDRVELQPGTTTVLWHSVFWQYVAPAEQERLTTRIAELGAQATPDAHFAHLSLEAGQDRAPGADHVVTLESWPEGERRVLGTARAHGVPVHWAPRALD
ncbi:DUF2332 domain-containing protein [Motilibacter deserti]|uniref:DUF2332 domain-containing protein n=1 Tax=Motilibacter deserti TaxID=2714956 RepID=A0ABX0GTS0_9ACTN|nr:DUF2332 domain-containing protein [Motilibacter deserti]